MNSTIEARTNIDNLPEVEHLCELLDLIDTDQSPTLIELKNAHADAEQAKAVAVSNNAHIRKKLYREWLESKELIQARSVFYKGMALSGCDLKKVLLESGIYRYRPTTDDALLYWPSNVCSPPKDFLPNDCMEEAKKLLNQFIEQYFFNELTMSELLSKT